MKFLSNEQYTLMKDTIKRLKAENKELKKKNKVLENDKQILLLLINPDIAHLDFPNNSKGGNDDPELPGQHDIWSL